eukprot:Opistho-2@8874
MRWIRSSSMQPPETEPTVSPRALMAISEPGGRGEEPQVRATVISTTARPSACQRSAPRSTRVSRSSMAVVSAQIERQLALGLAGQPCDGIGEGRRQRRQARLAHAGGRISTRHDVDGELRHIGDAGHREVTEVALLHLSVLQGDGRAGQAHGQAHHRGPLQLGLDGARIDGQIAVHAGRPMYSALI